jgi:mannose-6-phosphate isomerase-like protein (cupin superfamily)
MGTGRIYITDMDIKGERTMTTKPEPKIVALDRDAMEYLRVLGGPPESVTMRSGYVVLLPDKSVGPHSTESYEEMVVVLDGEGEMLFEEGRILQLETYTVAYCPPGTEHDVRNTGSKPLRYVYIVARAH